ncbi:MAG: hypothetical protein FD180_3482 [Planctomycetota bacterium]|nr:MAG: hypothetical protein FD180_3482 [Planctomycetota bacterium]
MRAPFATSQSRRSRQAFLEACQRSEVEETETDILCSRRGRSALDSAEDLRNETAARLRRGELPERRAKLERLLKDLNAGLGDPRVARAWLAQDSRALKRLLVRGILQTPRQAAADRLESMRFSTSSPQSAVGTKPVAREVRA